MRRILSVFLSAIILMCCTSISICADAETGIIVYPAPAGETMNDDFTLEIKNGKTKWKKVPIYNVVVSDGTLAEGDTTHQRNASMAYFDFSGTVDIRVTYNAGDVGNFRIRPDAKGIEYERNENTIEFSLTNPEKLLIQVDDKYKEQLHLFANPIEDYQVDEKDPNVMYFGPGVHTSLNNKNIKTYWINGYAPWNRDIVVVPSNTTVYIAGGAVVHACFVFADEYFGSPDVVVRGAKNSKILGHGIISGIWHTSRDGYLASPSMRKPGYGSPCGIYVKNCEDITLDGFIYLNSGQYGISNVNTYNYTINNVKVFDCMIWGDGINSYACHDVKINDCFVRSSDDCIPIYAGTGSYAGMGSSNFEVTDNTLFADLAHCIYVGSHGSQDDNNKAVIEDLNFKNNYLLDAYTQGAGYFGIFAIGCGDSNIVRNVTFENIEVEDFTNSSLFQFCTQKGGYNPIAGYLVENVTLKNINYNGKNINASVISGYEEGRIVRNVSIENLTINGKPIVDPDDGNIKIYANVENVVFKHDDVEGEFPVDTSDIKDVAVQLLSMEDADLVIIRKPCDIIIDGDTSDWAGIETVSLPEQGGSNIPSLQYKGEKDLSAKLAFTYDEDKFYVLADVRDDRHNCMNGEASFWEGDSFQIAFNNKGNEFGPEYSFSTEGVVYKGTTGKQFGSDEAMKEIHFEAKLVADHCIYEIEIPWLAIFEKKPEDGVTLGTLVNENDGTGRLGWIFWGDGIGSGKTVTDFKNVVFEKECPFEDIKGHWAEDEVEYLYKKGIISGVDATHYAPDNPVSRAELLALTMRCVNMNGNAYHDAYADVQKGDWFARNAQAAKNKKFFNENMIFDNMMKPNQAILREETADVIANVLEYQDLLGNEERNDEFLDDGDISEWARPSVYRIANKGYIVGNQNKFEPKSNLTRGEAATIISKVYKSIFE